MIPTVAARPHRRVPSSSSSAQKFVYIVSSALASLPSPGNRVGTSDASNMPTIQSTAGNSAITTSQGAHHFRFVGIKFLAPSAGLAGTLLNLGGGETSLSQFPTDIFFDRCIVKGDTTNGLLRGIRMEVIRGAAVDSRFYDIGIDGSDSQAVWACNTPGPLKMVNNHFEAAGENVMMGGGDPKINGVFPSDIEIRENYFYKPLAWKGVSTWDVKNLLEFKLGNRVLVEGNVMENCWADGQNGTGFLITPRNQDGGATWSQTRDITFRYNQILKVGNGINIDGEDNAFVSQHSTNIVIEHNLVTVTKPSGLNIEPGRQINYTSGPINCVTRHNTFIDEATGDTATSYIANDTVTPCTGFVFENNVCYQGTYGVWSDTPSASGMKNVAVAQFSGGYTARNNAIVGGSSGEWPAGNNNAYPANTAAVGFTSSGTGDYSLTSGSSYHNAASDGTDIGANFTTMATKTQHSVDGQWGSERPKWTASSYDVAELPRSYIDTAYSAQSGTVWNCANASDLTTALAGCALGDTIVLTAGNTFTGTFNLRNI